MATRKKTETSLPAAPPPKRRGRPPKTAPAQTKEVPAKPEAVVGMTGWEPAPAHQRVKGLTPEQLEMGLRATSTPGVYINAAQVLVDADGVMLDYADVKGKDSERWEKILGGPADTPAKLLKAVALDPQQALAVRMDAAKAAAPYFDRKKPIGIDGGEDGAPINVLHTHKLQGMAQTDLNELERLLRAGAPEDQVFTLTGPAA